MFRRLNRESNDIHIKVQLGHESMEFDQVPRSNINPSIFHDVTKSQTTESNLSILLDSDEEQESDIESEQRYVSSNSRGIESSNLDEREKMRKKE